MSLSTVEITDQFDNTTTTAFRDGDTLAALMDYLGFDISNLLVTVNDQEVASSYVLEDGDEIALASKKVKSGN